MAAARSGADLTASKSREQIDDLRSSIQRQLACLVLVRGDSIIVSALLSNDIFMRLSPLHMSRCVALPAASGVVAELLSQLTPKQRKPANMGPAYKAACSSGCRPVLAALLVVAAADPRQQLPALMKAAAAAGNLDAWRQILQPQLGNHNAAQQQQQQQEVSAFDWSVLSLLQIKELLQLVLPQSPYDAFGHIMPAPQITTQQQQWQAAEEAARLQIADLLWQVLVVQQNREADLREYLNLDFPDPLLITLWNFAKPRAAQWLLRHQLVPAAGHESAQPRRVLWQGIADAAAAGDFACALELHSSFTVLPPMCQQRQQRLLRKRGEVCLDPQLQAAALVQQSVRGHLRRACAAGDAAAVAQLERLAYFAGNMFSSTEVSRSGVFGHSSFIMRMDGAYGFKNCH
jgi:hypothetical protein